MSADTPDPSHAPLHESVYDGLPGSDDSQWAFGTDFEDPLAGLDTTVPDGVDQHDLAAGMVAKTPFAAVALRKTQGGNLRADLHDLTGSMIASRFSESQKSMNSSRSCARSG